MSCRQLSAQILAAGDAASLDDDVWGWLLLDCWKLEGTRRVES